MNKNDTGKTLGVKHFFDALPTKWVSAIYPCQNTP